MEIKGGPKLNFITVRCCNCNSVLLNLPESELKRLDGLTFRCECCGNKLLLEGKTVVKSLQLDPYRNIYQYDF